jgi:hypothetical protein
MLETFGVSHGGLDRQRNEDAFLCRRDLGLFAVADGMGGHSAGEIASHLALDALEAFLLRTADDTDFTWPFGVDPNLSFDANRDRKSDRTGLRATDIA